jgi:hypothetical protein
MLAALRRRWCCGARRDGTEALPSNLCMYTAASDLSYPLFLFTTRPGRDGQLVMEYRVGVLWPFQRGLGLGCATAPEYVQGKGKDM